MFSRRMTDGTRKMGLELPDGAIEKCARFYDILREENKHMNLTRVIDDPVEVADVHFLDSFSAIGEIPFDTKTLIDVGAGAGFPGIPLAIALPHVKVTLVDALDKRVRFLNGVIQALSLNAQAVHMRAEDAAKAVHYRERYDIATARAVANLAALAELTLPLVRIGGKCIAFKGPQATEEMAAASRAIRILGGGAAEVRPVTIPDHEDWMHCLVVMKKVGRTPDQYPRRAGEPLKKPL